MKLKLITFWNKKPNTLDSWAQTPHKKIEYENNFNNKLTFFFSIYFSREYLANLKPVIYKQNLDFSYMNVVNKKKRNRLPPGWNLNCVDSFLNDILEVSYLKLKYISPSHSRVIQSKGVSRATHISVIREQLAPITRKTRASRHHSFYFLEAVINGGWE